MLIKVIKYAGGYAVQFTHGVQTFTLNYIGSKEEAKWMKSQLYKCFKHFENDILDKTNNTKRIKIERIRQILKLK